MSNRKGKWKHPQAPRSDAADVIARAEPRTDRCADCGAPLFDKRGRAQRCICDPTSGRYGHEAGAVARCRAKPWHWNPGREVRLADGTTIWIYPDPELGVRAIHGSWTSAHAGTVSDLQKPDEIGAFFAGLDADERELVPLLAAELRTERVAPGTYAKIATALRLTRRQVESRIASVRRKIREADAVRTAWRGEGAAA